MDVAQIPSLQGIVSMRNEMFGKVVAMALLGKEVFQWRLNR